MNEKACSTIHLSKKWPSLKVLFKAQDGKMMSNLYVNMNDCQDLFVDICIALKPLLNKLTRDGNVSLHIIKSPYLSPSLCTLSDK